MNTILGKNIFLLLCWCYFFVIWHYHRKFTLEIVICSKQTELNVNTSWNQKWCRFYNNAHWEMIHNYLANTHPATELWRSAFTSPVFTNFFGALTMPLTLKCRDLILNFWIVNDVSSKKVYKKSFSFFLQTLQLGANFACSRNLHWLFQWNK